MKRISALMLLCLLTALFLPASAQAASSLVLPSSLLEIGEEAFRCDTSIETVVLPESLTAIGANAFSDSGLRQIVIPVSVANIADNAFDNCGGLEAVVAFDSYAHRWCVGHGISIRFTDEKDIGPGNAAAAIRLRNTRILFLISCIFYKANLWATVMEAIFSFNRFSATG